MKPTVVITVETMVICHTVVTWVSQNIEVVTTVQSNHGVGSFVKESFLSLFE